MSKRSQKQKVDDPKRQLKKSNKANPQQLAGQKKSLNTIQRLDTSQMTPNDVTRLQSIIGNRAADQLVNQQTQSEMARGTKRDIIQRQEEFGEGEAVA